MINSDPLKFEWIHKARRIDVQTMSIIEILKGHFDHFRAFEASDALEAFATVKAATDERPSNGILDSKRK